MKRFTDATFCKPGRGFCVRCRAQGEAADSLRADLGKRYALPQAPSDQPAHRFECPPEKGSLPWGYTRVVVKGKPPPTPPAKSPKPRRVALRVSAEIAAARLAKCNACPHNARGICLKVKEKYPNRSGRIGVGVLLPQARCPLKPREWDAEPTGRQTPTSSAASSAVSPVSAAAR